MIRHDFHLHTSFSSDSETPMRDMIDRGIFLGLSAMCFTEHMDMDFPRPPQDPMDFEVDTDSYYKCLCELRHEYRDKLQVLFGVELGFQPHLKERCEAYANRHPFDFIIGSSHIVGGIDPFFPSFYEGRSEDASYRAYFESELDNIRHFDCFDVYGHLDYVVRYGPNKNQFYSYQKFSDILDEILRALIERGKGIEVNTGGLKYGLGHPNPTEDIIRRYHELGGEIITVGSDAHVPEYVAYQFKNAASVLQECGFSYYTYFVNRQPKFVRL